jgi:hypothetical protein
MADVYLNVYGDGTATTDATPPMTEGEIFTIFFHPDGDSELLDVRAFDSHDYSVALPPVTDNELTMRFRSGWGSLYVDIYFTYDNRYISFDYDCNGEYIYRTYNLQELFDNAEV